MTSGSGPPADGPRRILVAIDGSPAADLAVELVAGLAWPPGTSIRVLEAVDLGPGLFGGPWPSLALTQADELEGALRADAGREVRAASERLEASGRTVTTTVVAGRPATAIVDEAGAVPADLVVLGSRGHGTITAMLLGSVSSEVIDHAPAPVLVARGGVIRRVVLAWDGSTSAEDAATAVRTWRIFSGVDVRVVTVADVGIPWWAGFSDPGAPGAGDTAGVILEAADAARAVAAQLANDMVGSLQAAGRAATADPREGDAAAGIIDAANEVGADLVVIGTHGRTGLARLALGSVAANVLRHAHCSVLVVRASRAGAGREGTTAS